MDLLKKMKKVDYERHSQFQNEIVRRAEAGKRIHSMKMISVKIRYIAHSQQEVDSVKTMDVEGEYFVQFSNEVDPAKIMEFTEENVGDQPYTGSPGKMRRRRENSILASKATGKKMAIRINKVKVGLAPSPNLKTVTAKVVSWSNQTHRATGSRVKIHNEKLDYSKVPAKIKLRNICMQSDGNKNLQKSESSLWMHEGGQAWLIDSENIMEFTEENVGDPPYMETPDKMGDEGKTAF
jgi:hypothetical protein